MIASGEGLGNTFWIAQAAQLQAAGIEPSQYAVQVCAGPEPRDGLLIVHPADADGIQTAEVINRDGSDGGVCLNGLRVLAVYSELQRGVFRMADRNVSWQRFGSEIELHLAAEYLSPNFWNPTPLEVCGKPAYAVDFWNPHCVIPVPAPEEEDLSILAAAAREHTQHFPDGVNVELIAAPRNGNIVMRVQERGVGETKACGSGAVAVAAVAWTCLNQPPEQPLKVQMAGGDLLLRQDGMGGIFVRGGAEATAMKVK